jgi:hypothetical protein
VRWRLFDNFNDNTEPDFLGAGGAFATMHGHGNSTVLLGG